MAFVYNPALGPPVVNLVNKEQCFSCGFVVDGSGNFSHRRWQTKAAESLGITRLRTDAFKSPDLSVCKQRVFLSTDIVMASVIVVLHSKIV